MDGETKKYLAKHGLDGVIRIQQEEYDGFPGGELLTHFNLEKTTVEAGKRYALPRILKNGYVDQVSGVEVLPELSFEPICHAVCLSVRNHVAYESLTPADFAHSFSHIQTRDELKSFILKRYSRSKPGIESADLLKRGVAVIELQVLPE